MVISSLSIPLILLMFDEGIFWGLIGIAITALSLGMNYVLEHKLFFKVKAIAQALPGFES